jgi:hypothetical protein
MTTCTQIRATTQEPLAGTSPHARLWVLLEQPGPWGRDALTQSHLPAATGRALAALCDGPPIRVGLIRRVGSHADITDAPRTLLLARTDKGRTWLKARSVEEVESLPGELDIDALLSADSPPDHLPGRPLPTPGEALLVCTNAKRDQCCAVLGRPLALSLADSSDDRTQVWETTHTSGHRFAPTFVSLPDGYLFGGPDAASRSLDACRGRSSLPAEAQVAELAVLLRLGATGPSALDVRGPAAPTAGSAATTSSWQVTAGSTTFTVDVSRTAGADRPESCGKEPVPFHLMTASIR